MASPRLRRLLADYELVMNEFTGHPTIQVQPAGGDPPERYVVTYRITGVQDVDQHGRPILSRLHTAEIYLHQEYPREKPRCTMRTPLWHPNVKNVICIADHWAPGETLVDVVVQIGKIIQYRSYNPSSALNLAAARWACAHTDLFPVGTESLYQPDLDIQLSGPAPAGPADDDDGGIIPFSTDVSDDTAVL